MAPEASESHTHLAHAVIRYLGLTAPEELVPFGINNAAGIVDLISRVRLHLLYLVCFSQGPFVPVCNQLYHTHFVIFGATGCLCLSVGRAGQSFV